jgi:CRP/FNR family cyclic AMP-dependent transcriptional regulator
VSQSLPDMLLRDARRGVGGRQPEQRPRRTRRRTAAALATVPLFGELSKRALERIAKETDELGFEPGEVIVQEGSLGETLFVVLEGAAKVVRGGRTIAQLMPGDFFGELSALEPGPRTASVIAVTPVRVLRLFRHTLMALLERDPRLTIRLLEGVVRRLREVERNP